jgi:hypothetical protein
VRLGDARQNVAVGRKVGRIDNHGFATWSSLNGGTAKLVEVHRSGVANQRLAGRRTQYRTTE